MPKQFAELTADISASAYRRLELDVYDPTPLISLGVNRLRIDDGIDEHCYLVQSVIDCAKMPALFQNRHQSPASKWSRLQTSRSLA